MEDDDDGHDDDSDGEYINGGDDNGNWLPTCTGAFNACKSTHALPLCSSITVLEGGIDASPK